MERTLTPTEYRLLVEHSPVMVWRSGVDAKCDYFNRPWLDFTGRTLAQELGDGWAEGVHPEDFERCVALYRDHFARREPFEMEYRLRRHDGQYRWIFDRGVPYTGESGAFAGFIGSCVDVDDRRRAQAQQLQRSEEELAQAHDFEKWILAIVSHDIRNPLNTIQLSARVLALTSEPDSAARRQSEVIARAVNRISHIVGDLLDLSREREGAGISVKARPSDLRAMCQRIIDELAGVARDRAITLDCSGDFNGAWDEQRLMQAISNLASNALQHGTPGSPVRIRVSGGVERVAVEVTNKGAIRPDLLPRIFEPFRSGRHHGSRGEGLGLGLFIANAIARAHGGVLEVEASDDETTFRLVLPRQAPAEKLAA